MKPLSDIWLLIRCYPIAKACVLKQSETDYIGSVRMQISYNEVRTNIVKAGIRSNSTIVGAVVYIAISLAYLFNKRY
jgi:hypothetical protein